MRMRSFYVNAGNAEMLPRGHRSVPTLLGWINASKQKHRESTVWQRRFWGHRIRDDEDFARHADYIHFNSVKHNHVRSAAEWPYSTFHRYVREGVYAADWAGSEDAPMLAYDRASAWAHSMPSYLAT